MTTQGATDKVYANEELVEMTILTLDEIHGLSSILRETNGRTLNFSLLE